MTRSIKDWRDNEIEVGDVILYAVKHSTSVEVNEAVVKAFGDRSRYDSHTGPTIIVEWIRSSDGEWADKWRQVKQVTITNTKAVTLISKGG